MNTHWGLFQITFIFAVPPSYFNFSASCTLGRHVFLQPFKQLYHYFISAKKQNILAPKLFDADKKKTLKLSPSIYLFEEESFRHIGGVFSEKIGLFFLFWGKLHKFNCNFLPRFLFIWCWSVCSFYLPVRTIAIFCLVNLIMQIGKWNKGANNILLK